MDFPPVPHFGTTLEARPAAPGADPWSFAPDEMLARTDRFLRVLGLDVFQRNDFGPLGRQLLYCRAGRTSRPTSSSRVRPTRSERT